jgi:Ca-activated chloride channel family protein
MAEIVPPIINCLTVVFLVIALARPQRVTAFDEDTASGRDILMVLDISGSMQALDFFLDNRRVNRLEALKFVVKEFVRARAGDRVGLVTFADRAFTMCPLTLDTTTLTDFVDRLELGMAGEGTAIGDGIAVALRSFRELPSESKVLVLVTDGKNNSGAMSPIDAARIASSMGVKIHVVGIGGTDPVPIPMRDVFGRQVLVQQRLEYDEGTLRQIARISGGEYFNAKDLEGLQEVYRQIDTLEAREDKSYQHFEYQELFQPWALSAVGLMLLNLWLTLRVLRVMPTPPKMGIFG